MDVVAESGDVSDAVGLAEKHRPDAVLLDMTLPGLNGLEAARRITRDLPGIKVVMLSAYANAGYLAQALRAGAVGYVMKDAALVEIEPAIRAAVRGDIYVSPALSPGTAV